MERFAARASPSVMTRERLLRATLSSLTPFLQSRNVVLTSHPAKLQSETKPEG